MIELRDLARENHKVGKMTAVNYHRRYHNNFERMKEMISQGKIGKVEQINMVARDPVEPHEIYVLASGGLFKDMSVHDIDMARYVS
jgi:myo-inositol 2-dehydrogenase/D-chiro-inositol 1-dehydrogenase